MERIFISYSSLDRGFVEQLVRDLRAYGLEPWYDRGEMMPGDSLIQNIGNAIMGDDYFLVVLSPNTADSDWVQKELGIALSRELREQTMRVIPALIEDCPIPAFLQDKVFADFRFDYREGLKSVVRAVRKYGLSFDSASSVPFASKESLVWSNVIGDNLIRDNLEENNTTEGNMYPLLPQVKTND